MQNHSELTDKLQGYEIDGDIVELCNAIISNAKVSTTLNDVISVLKKDKTNYLRIGYGKTLKQAYENIPAVCGSCRLIHIYFHSGKIGISELYSFITGLGEGKFFGYTADEKIESRVKLVAIFN